MKTRFISNNAKNSKTRHVVSEYANDVASRVRNEEKAEAIRNVSNLVKIGAWINPISAINKIKTILKR